MTKSRMSMGLRWENFGVMSTDDGHKIYFSGEEGIHDYGFGFLVHKDIERHRGRVVRAARLWYRKMPCDNWKTLSVNPAANGNLFRIREG